MSHSRLTNQKSCSLDDEILPWSMSSRTSATSATMMSSSSSLLLGSSWDAFDDSFMNASAEWDVSFSDDDEFWNQDKGPKAIEEEEECWDVHSFSDDDDLWNDAEEVEVEEENRRGNNQQCISTSRDRMNYAKLLVESAIEISASSYTDEEVEKETSSIMDQKNVKNVNKRIKSINLTAWKIREQEKHHRSKRPSGAKRKRLSKRVSLESCASIYSN